MPLVQRSHKACRFHCLYRIPPVLACIRIAFFFIEILGFHRENIWFRSKSKEDISFSNQLKEPAKVVFEAEFPKACSSAVSPFTSNL